MCWLGRLGAGGNNRFKEVLFLAEVMSWLGKSGRQARWSRGNFDWKLESTSPSSPPLASPEAIFLASPSPLLLFHAKL